MRDGAKYLMLFEQLKREIVQGTYRGGDRIPGENELAEQYGMSRQTVRQALSMLEREQYIERRQGSGTYVRESTRGRKRTWNVGVIATYISEYIFPSILRGIERELSDSGFFPLLSATQNRVDNERKILEDYMEKEIDGLIVEGTKSALPNPNIGLYEKIESMGIPVVFFNGCYPALPDCVSVTTDDRQGGLDAVQYLVTHGHKKIGAIFKGDDRQGLERYAGYMQGLIDSGLPMQDDWVVWFHSEDRNLLLDDENETRRVLRAFRECSAVVCYNDEIAVKLLNAFRRDGLEIPGEKAIISFDNSLLSEVSTVKITSLDHPREHLGAAAARKLLAMMEGKKEKSLVLSFGGIVEKDSV